MIPCVKGQSQSLESDLTYPSGQLITQSLEPMNLSALDQLEKSVQMLVSDAQEEVEAKRIEKLQNQYYQQALRDIQQRLEGLLESVSNTLEQLPEEEFGDSDNRQRLLETRDNILEQLEAAPQTAAMLADQQFLLQEERLLEEKQQQQDNIWRQQLKEDLLDMIEEQVDFFSATDAAITVRGYLQDLKAIDALDEVVR